MDEDSGEGWERVDRLARKVTGEFASVTRIEAVPYVDSLERAGVHFTVWLRDKPDGSDYAWAELSPIEKRLSAELQEMDADRIPYTDYVLDSEAADRAAATQ